MTATLNFLSWVFEAWHQHRHRHGKIMLLCKLDKSTDHYMRGQFLELPFEILWFNRKLTLLHCSFLLSGVALKSVQPTEKLSKNFLENSACEITKRREGWRGLILPRILSNSKISGRVHNYWMASYLLLFCSLGSFFYDQQYSECEQGKNAFDISCTYCHAVGMYFFKHTVFP